MLIYQRVSYNSQASQSQALHNSPTPGASVPPVLQPQALQILPKAPGTFLGRHGDGHIPMKFRDVPSFPRKETMKICGYLDK